MEIVEGEVIVDLGELFLDGFFLRLLEWFPPGFGTIETRSWVIVEVFSHTVESERSRGFGVQ